MPTPPSLPQAARNNKASLTSLTPATLLRTWGGWTGPSIGTRSKVRPRAGRLGHWILRRTFGPLVVRTAPRVEEIERLARGAGWQVRARRDDREQPVYVIELA